MSEILAVKDKIRSWAYKHFLCDWRVLGHRSQALILGRSNSQWLYPIASVVKDHRSPPPPSTAQTVHWIIGHKSYTQWIFTIWDQEMLNQSFLTHHITIQLLCVSESFRHRLCDLFKINFMFVWKWNKYCQLN